VTRRAIELFGCEVATSHDLARCRVAFSPWVDVPINADVALENGVDMGISDSIGGMADKAKDMASEHPDEVEGAVNKVADKADDATGNKFSDQIDKGKDMAGDAIKKMKK
jgi:antitoxin protein of toxin-antitoxin system